MGLRPTILLIGLGDLGGVILELLAREQEIGRIVVASRNAARGEARCNLARLGAMAQGYWPDIEFVPLDLHQIEATAEAISQISPQIVLSTASLMTWWLPNLFPQEQKGRLLRAGFGPWLPVHLALPIKLMQAAQMADYRGHTLIGSYPDAVNPILNALGLPPTCGFGNLDEMAAKIRWLAAKQLGVNPADLQVKMVGHHALEAWVFGDREGEPPPCFLEVSHRGQDVTNKIEADRMLISPFPLPMGPLWHFLSAGSAVRLVRALLSEGKTALHAPGPLGLPGGYPVLAHRSGLELALPESLSLEQAIEINRCSQRYDGIDRIEADGTVVFCPENTKVMRRALGYACHQLKPQEAEAQALDLMARFRRFGEKHGVEIPI